MPIKQLFWIQYKLSSIESICGIMLISTKNNISVHSFIQFYNYITTIFYNYIATILPFQCNAINPKKLQQKN